VDAPHERAPGLSTGPGAGPDLDLFGRAPRRHRDWSHRRGEPRGLALGWTLYLMGATLASLMPVMTVSRVDSGVYRPAARLLMVLIMIGGCVLWPMLRAGQIRPEQPGKDVLRDLVVLLVPSLTLIWPQVLLAGWSVPVIGAVSALVIGWFCFIGGWLRLSYGLDGWSVRERIVAVALPLAVVAVLPGVLWLGGVLSDARPTLSVSRAWMWTPATGVWELVRDRSWTGGPAWAGRGHWIWSLSVLAAGVLCLVLSGVANRGRTPYRP
jgi:hypothetical protein